MPSKTVPPVWRRAFLRALGKGASVTRAASHAGVGRCQPYRYREENPLFARLWAEAKAHGRCAIAEGRAVTKPEPAPLFPVVRYQRNGRTCVVNAAEVHWNGQKELQFLTHLAASANVDASAKAAGMSASTLYRRRRAWPAFATAWDDAKAAALDQIEFRLIEAATNLLDPSEEQIAEPMPVTFDQALRLVKYFGQVQAPR